METSLKPITQAATSRAQTADPNGNRCLIENCTSERAVQLAHVFDREASADSRQTGALEWSWNMRKNTLNLDTRSNIFFLGASLHQMYKERRWALLPEDAVVHRYYDKNAIIARPRDKFPVIKDETFRYTFIPLKDMDDIYIARQSDPRTDRRCVNIHNYPYADFPTITSHVDPKFAILQLGFFLGSGIGLSARRSLVSKYPILRDISILYNRWIAYVPSEAEENLSYVPRPPSGGDIDDNDDEISSDGDSTCTPRRRIRLTRSAREEELALSSDSSSSDDTTYAVNVVANKMSQRKGVTSRGLQTLGRNKKTDSVAGGSQALGERRSSPIRPLTRKALRRQDDEESEGNKWTPKKIKTWAKGCDPPSPSVLPPPPPPRPPAKKLGRSRRKKR